MPTSPSAIAPATTPFASQLSRFGDQVAIVTAAGQLSYSELSERVQATARRLGSQRRLVLVAGTNQLDSLVAYLAALSAGHAVLLTSGGDPERLQSLVSTYDPDVVMGEVGGQWCESERRSGTAHDLHPDLALLLSTSGSTGSSKLVRLSYGNVQSNAEAIATYLEIEATDRAMTTLPMHYCYGLSVLNSHLLRGASVILTDLSVVDTCFWDLFHTHSATSFAGVPYTFDLLDRVGFATMCLPSLRYVTQAGGRLDAGKVKRLSRLGTRDGWKFFVMYGQTEATARMAYLPPELAVSHPNAIGIPVPGGQFRLDPLPDCPERDVGELVYSGPNVMLGYAEAPDDLRLGRTTETLHTGDIARRDSTGVFELIGRRSRFAKLFGLRIDLGQVEAELVADGVTACCVEADDELVVAVEGEHRFDDLRRLVARRCGLPLCAARICPFEQLPRLDNGKPDYQTVRTLARPDRLSSALGADPTQTMAAETASAGEVHRVGPVDAFPGAGRDRRSLVGAIRGWGARVGAIRNCNGQGRGDGVGGVRHPGRVAETAALCHLYAELLDRRDVSSKDTFVSLAGDSLSYVEMSIRLEEALGHLPENWHVTPIADLTPSRRRAWASWRSVEANVALRAAAILTIVGSHANVFTLLGGAHVLLAVAGFNFARFQLTAAGRQARIRHQLGSVLRIAVPSVACIAVGYALTDHYSVANIFLLNGIVGPDTWTTEWHFWFIEVLLYILLALTAMLAVPGVARLERRFGFECAVAALVIGLLLRYDVIRLDTGPDRVHTAHVVFWLFAVGWATAKASRQGQRLLVTMLAVAPVVGFFGDSARELMVAAGLCLLIWVPTLRVPGLLIRPVSVLASSSLYIYLVHWLVYPRWEDSYPLVSLAASLVAGVAFWALWSPLVARLESSRILAGS